MAFDKLTARVPTEIGRFAIIVSQVTETDETTQRMQWESTIRYSDGDERIIRGALEPVLTTNQSTALLNLLNALVAKAQGEMLEKKE